MVHNQNTHLPWVFSIPVFYSKSIFYSMDMGIVVDGRAFYYNPNHLTRRLCL